MRTIITILLLLAIISSKIFADNSVDNDEPCNKKAAYCIYQYIIQEISIKYVNTLEFDTNIYNIFVRNTNNKTCIKDMIDSLDTMKDTLKKI